MDFADHATEDESALAVQEPADDGDGQQSEMDRDNEVNEDEPAVAIEEIADGNEEAVAEPSEPVATEEEEATGGQAYFYFHLMTHGIRIRSCSCSN